MPTGKRSVPGSSANYWQLSEQMIANVLPIFHRTDLSIPIPTEPHWYGEFVVAEVISEADGDHHLWLSWLNDPAGAGSKARFAAEITPQQAIPVPKVGDRIRVYGILRWDGQHNWWEIHPIDHIEPL